MYLDEDEEEMIVRWFREGDIVYLDGTKRKPTDDEIMQAEISGELVGANGIATLFATCLTCGWKDHTHFVIGDDERDMAYDILEQAHISRPKSCDGELSFKERSR
ncbi:MAG: hypothetical protein AAB758_02000 [Patescibacteria group bacterium]